VDPHPNPHTNPPANPPAEEFISEAIEPVAGTADASAMSRGEPGLPARFVWRGRTFEVAQVLRTWKTSSPSGGEMYLRRHWYAIRCVSGDRMTLYCERQAKTRKKPTRRWWLYSAFWGAPADNI
jgi:hypothetical protein